MADRSDATDEWAFRLIVVSTSEENVTIPTRVLPLSISNLETSCDRNDFTRSKFVEPILPDSSTTKMTSAGHSVVGGGGDDGDGVVGDGPTTPLNVNITLPIVSSRTCIQFMHAAL